MVYFLNTPLESQYNIVVESSVFNLNTHQEERNLASESWKEL